jgi:hypothetical protein
MPVQNYKNHSTINYLTKSTITYYVLAIGLTFITAANLLRTIMNANGRISAAMSFFMAITFVVAYFMFRSFSIKAQDRAIRAEENFRCFLLSGEKLSSQLKISQIIALRFASDEEFLALADKAVKENLSNKQIKELITNWKADYHRA